MTTTNFNAAEIRAAYEAGRSAALSIRVGDVFDGASPAGEKAGYARDTWQHGIFTHAYLSVLPQVWTHRDTGVVSKLETKIAR